MYIESYWILDLPEYQRLTASNTPFGLIFIGFAESVAMTAFELSNQSVCPILDIGF
jgi:hypothetical protein